MAEVAVVEEEAAAEAVAEEAPAEVEEPVAEAAVVEEEAPAEADAAAEEPADETKPDGSLG